MIVNEVVDTTPDSFDIEDRSLLGLGATIYSNEITVSGINTTVDITTTLGTLVIDGVDTDLDSATGTNDTKVKIKYHTDYIYGSSKSGTLHIGDGTDGFRFTNIAAPANHAPTATDLSITTDEGTAKSFGLLGSDQDGDSLTYAIVSQPSNGTLTTTNGATVTYTPNTGFF